MQVGEKRGIGRVGDADDELGGSLEADEMMKD